MPRRFLKHGARLARGVTLQVAEGVDRAVARTALNPGPVKRRRSSAESLGHDARIEALSVLERFYNQPAHLDPAGPFFPAPEQIEPSIHSVRRFGQDGEVRDLRWPSHFEPLWSLERAAEALRGDLQLERLQGAALDRTSSLRDKYVNIAPNMEGHARWFHHRGQVRPCVVLLHGYLGGNYLLEERMWPVRRLFDGGLDVVLSVLPFHGARRDPARGLRAPAFPSSDPRFTVEGMRHMVHDHRALFDFLRDGRVSSLGVMGMSLGGYSAALLSTVEPLEFAVLLIPLAAIDRFAHEHGRMVGQVDQQVLQADALRRAHSVVSPLARPSLLPPGRAIVIAGEADRVTGLAHSRALAEHFDGEHITFDGGHILQTGRARAFEPVWRMLAGAGVYDGPSA